MGYAIEPMERTDWTQVRAIYGAGLATGLAAFTTTAPRWDDWNKGHLALGRLVARDDAGNLTGFAALAPVPDT